MMKIDSDFEDYYDAALRACDASELQEDAVLVRRRDRGLSRPEAFFLLEALGMPVVAHGIVEDVCRQLRPEDHVVVYRDVCAHGVAPDGGDALLLARRDDALRCWPHSYCSAYALHLDVFGCVHSFSLVAVGLRRFATVTHQYDPYGNSPCSWASNRGRSHCYMVQELLQLDYNQVIRHPLWSIDYLMVAHEPGRPPVPTAIDFNTAPILVTTGLQHVLGPEEAARLITEAWRYYNAGIHDSHHEGGTSNVEEPEQRA